jgi:hypothetical protein
LFTSIEKYASLIPPNKAPINAKGAKIGEMDAGEVNI